LRRATYLLDQKKPPGRDANRGTGKKGKRRGKKSQSPENLLKQKGS